MNRDRKGSGSGSGTTHPDLTSSRKSRITSGPVHEGAQGNPVNRTGRPDGTEVDELTSGPRSRMSSGWGGGKGGEDPSIRRTGRPLFEGKVPRGVGSNETLSVPDPVDITAPSANPGGAIGPA